METESAAGIATISDADDKHTELAIMDFIKDAVVSAPDSPCVRFTFQRQTPGRAGLVLQAVDCIYDSAP